MWSRHSEHATQSESVTSLTVLSKPVFYPGRHEPAYSPFPLVLDEVSAVVPNDWPVLAARPCCQSDPRLIGATHYFCNFGYVFSLQESTPA